MLRVLAMANGVECHEKRGSKVLMQIVQREEHGILIPQEV